MESSQYKVAIEFAFPPLQVRRVLQQHQFPCAGDLIEYLYNLQGSTDEQETETVLQDLTQEEEQQQQQKENIEMKTVLLHEEKSSLSELKSETVLLLYMRRCLCCHKNDRNIVTLPCSHLTHCLTCSPSVSVCPNDECKMTIERKIPIYRT